MLGILNLNKGHMLLKNEMNANYQNMTTYYTPNICI